MIARYLILAGPREGRPGLIAGAVARLEQQTDLRLRSQPGDGLVVMANDAACATRLADGAGWLIGTLFEPLSQGAGIARLDDAAFEDLIDSRGAMLVERYWGSYVAILCSGAEDRCEIVRDPSRALPCYWLREQGLLVLASHVELLCRAGVYAPRVAWTALARHLCADEVRHDATCLAGLSEVARGARLSWSGGAISSRALWLPWQFAERDRQLRDLPEAIERVRRTTLSCVAAWAREYDHLLLSLSGGLDSAIMAACLARAGTPFTMLNLATEGGQRDERRYARLVAQAVGRPLVERIEDPAGIDLDQSHAAHLPRPLARLFAQIGHRHYLEVAQDVGAQAFFGGGGGDNVFCSMRSAAPVVDRILVDGPGPGAWQVLKDVSSMTQSSLWDGARQTIHRGWLRKRGYRWAADTRFLSRDAAGCAAQAIDHPWLKAPRRALPGKAVHIAWLVGFQNHLEGFAREELLPKLSPLLSQPLVELCLQIPSWMWCTGGRDRAIARLAFARDLPQAVIDRRGKGSPDGAVAALYEQTRPKIRTLLLDGLLRREGLIDPDALARALDRPGPVRGTDFVRIMGLVDAEMWARRWDTGRPSVDQAPLPPRLPSFPAT